MKLIIMIWTSCRYCFFIYEFLCLSCSASPVPSVRLLTKWLDVFPSEKVEFECSISNKSEYTFTWSRDGKEITASNPGDGSLLMMTVDTWSSGIYTCKALHTATGRLATASSEILTVHCKWDSLFVHLRGTAVCEIKFPGSSMSFSQQQ